MMHSALALPIGFSLIIAALGEKFCGGYEYAIYPTYIACENDCLCNCHEPCECNFMGSGFECRSSSVRSRPIFAQSQFEYPETTNINYDFTTPYSTNNHQSSGFSSHESRIGLLVIAVLIAVGLITICCCGICCCGWFGIRAKKSQPGHVLKSPQQPIESTVGFTNTPERTAPPAPNPVYLQAPSAPGYF